MYRSYASYAEYVQKYAGKFIGYQDVMRVLTTCTRSLVKDAMNSKLSAMASALAALSQRNLLTPRDFKYKLSLDEQNGIARLFMFPREDQLSMVAAAELRVASDVLQEWSHIHISTDVSKLT